LGLGVVNSFIATDPLTPLCSKKDTLTKTEF
jgi:hypothetical protein